MHKACFCMVFSIFLLLLQPVNAAEKTVELSGFDLAKSYLYEEYLYHSETGKVWFYDWQEGADDAGRRTVRCMLLGPHTLPETEDIDGSILCTLDSTIMEHEFSGYTVHLLGFQTRTTDKNSRTIHLSLQVKASDGWFTAITEHIYEGELLDFGGEKQEPVLDVSLGTSARGSGHSKTLAGTYRVVASRQTGDKWALSVREFDLNEAGSHFQVELKG